MILSRLHMKDMKAPPFGGAFMLFDRHGSMSRIGVVRLDTKTGQMVEYPLPRETTSGACFVDDKSNPGTLWVGSNHGASIVR